MWKDANIQQKLVQYVSIFLKKSYYGGDSSTTTSAYNSGISLPPQHLSTQHKKSLYILEEIFR